MKIDSAPDTLSRFTFTSLGDKPSKPPTGLFAPLQTPSTSRPITPLKVKPAEQPVQTPDEKLKAVGQARESLQQLGYSTEEIDAVLERQTAQHTPYELEFSIMAEVRAYFQVTSMNFVDMVPKLIDRCFLMSFISDLAEHLHQELTRGNANSSDKLAKLLAEDTTIERKRKTLLERQKMFEAVYEEIVRFKI
ncbi:hypothetical protein FRC02_000284 [Tulasnella sp. 418]|nr:hypothetical protein FRC02_000284 [Tulasnella sp. 418]